MVFNRVKMCGLKYVAKNVEQHTEAQKSSIAVRFSPDYIFLKNW